MQKLDLLGLVQVVIAKEKVLKKHKNCYKENYNVQIIPDNCLLDKILFIKKIKKNYARIIQYNKNIILDTGIIHAHSWFSDGGVAFKIYKMHRIPYIISITNTDLNFFYKYFVHCRSFAEKVLIQAEKIITYSPAYKEKLLKVIPIKLRDKIIHKIIILPFGIDEYWTYNGELVKRVREKSTIKMIQVGELNFNKNAVASIEACKILNTRGIDTRLALVGKGKLERVLKMYTWLRGVRGKVDFKGYIADMKTLKSLILKSDIFILPSFRETFGLSYIEAISCAIPVIYSKGQGIDGYFQDGHIGYSVKPSNRWGIVSVILKIMSKHQKISYQAKNSVAAFDWRLISNQYCDIYENILNINKCNFNLKVRNE
jgi:glycosyltransferase involved in cell wall biosynthesis